MYERGAFRHTWRRSWELIRARGGRNIPANNKGPATAFVAWSLPGEAGKRVQFSGTLTWTTNPARPK